MMHRAHHDKQHGVRGHPKNTTIKLSQRWGVAHPRGASGAATGGEGNSATRARMHDDHRAMTTMIIIALAPPAAQNNKQQSTKDGLYEVDATGGQREGAGELRTEEWWGLWQGEAESAMGDDDNHDIRRSEEEPLTQQSNSLYNGNNNKNTTAEAVGCWRE